MLEDLTIIDIVKYAIWVPVAIAFVMAWRKRRSVELLRAEVAREAAPARRSIEAAWDEFARQYPPDRATAPGVEPAFVRNLPADVRIGWERFHAISFGSGRFWLADPDIWTPMMWFSIDDVDDPAEPLGLRVVARGAFGEVLIYDGNDRPYCWLFPLLVQGPAEYLTEHYGYEHTEDIRTFFTGPESLLLSYLKVGTRQTYEEGDDDDLPDLFDALVEMIGPVAEDEVYGTARPELLDHTWGVLPQAMSKVKVGPYAAAIAVES